MQNFISNIILPFIPLKIITNKFNPILLYHSLGTSSKFSNNIDHVNLEMLSIQIKTVKKYWKFVSIDEYASTKNKKGLASLTIDDGYKNVIQEALTIFKNLNIPITIFINSSTLDGKIFWRDKIRYLINNNLVEKYIKSSGIFTKDCLTNFYYISKDPKYNSIHIEKSIDEFFHKEKIILNNQENLCFDNKKYLIKDNLVSYGNHTHSHYMLSSLNKDEQYDEINKCKIFIDKLDVNKSEVFSIPFGGINSFNNDTISILKDLNYKKILKSTNDLDSNIFANQINRFMPKSYKMDNLIKKLYLKKIIKKKNF